MSVSLDRQWDDFLSGNFPCPGSKANRENYVSCLDIESKCKASNPYEFVETS